MVSLTPISNLYLQVRFPGEIHDVKEFVQPCQWHVQHLIEDMKSQGHNVSAELLWDWVCRNVEYPLDGRGHANEYHRLDAYALRPAYVLGWGQQVIPRSRQEVWHEWFDWPWEILSSPVKVADCDGAAILAASLILGIGRQAYVAIGGFAGEMDPLTHAWVVCSGQVWEVTTTEAGLALPEDNDVYVPLMYFNNTEILVAPGLDEALRRMNYVPNIDHLYDNFGFVHDGARKRSRIMSIYSDLQNYKKGGRVVL